ncbi:MAG: hypothetical protein LKG27_03285 [Clostridiaceae bacterium]|jgi:hypothetical protein|nr:hypothetical protein [Clostridiaceae bacterium]
MKQIFNAIKDIYSGENKMQVHAVLFSIAGIGTIIESLTGDYAKSMQNVKTFDPNFFGQIIGIIALIWLISLVVKIFMLGFNVSFIHRKLAKLSGLPEIENSFWLRGLMSFILNFIWTLGIGLAFGIIIIPLSIIVAKGTIALKIVSVLIMILLAFGLALITPFYSMLFISYAKNFSLHGLFNPKLLVCYIKSSFNDVMILLCKMLVLGIVLFAAIYVISIIVSALTSICGMDGKAIESLVMSLLGGYLGTILSLITFYCLTFIYKGKVEQELLNNGLIQ